MENLGQENVPPHEGEIGPKDIMEDGIWRPSLFEKYRDKFRFGGITNKHKEELGIGLGPELKLITRLDRLKKDSFSEEKVRLGRFLVTALKKIDSEANPREIVKTQLCHSSNVVLVDDDFLKKSPQEKIDSTLNTDGLITKEKEVPLCVTGADCSPVSIFDPENEAIGIFHSGWKGTVEGISVNGIKMMKDSFGSNPKNLVVSIGPSIDGNNYEVDNKVLLEFKKAFSEDEISKIFTPSNEEGKYLLDVVKAIKIQLINAGVLERSIQISDIKTTKDGEYFSSARQSEGVQNVDCNLYIATLTKTK